MSVRGLGSRTAWTDEGKRSLLHVLLVMFVGFCTTLCFFYSRFIHWTPICRTGPGRGTFKYGSNRPAYLEYGRRFRTGFAFGSKDVIRHGYYLIEKFKEGDTAHFEADSQEFMNQLLERVEQFDGQQVPDVLLSPHRKISRTHGLCYESVLFLKEAHRSMGEERQRLFIEAKKKMKEARTLQALGVTEFYRTWAVTP